MIILVEPMRIQVVAREKMAPARKVSTVSCQGRIQDTPFWAINGPTASWKKDSTAHSSRRIRNSQPAIKGTDS